MKTSQKISHKNPLLAILFTSLTLLVFTACDPEEPEVSINRPIQESFMVGPEGATITAMNGNVRLVIPVGALSDQVNLRITEGPQDYDNEFVIKSIEIRPVTLSFRIPASLQLRYDQQLRIGKELCTTDLLAVYHFQNEAAFDKRELSDMVWDNKCCVNQNDKCIETHVNGGGIFAIGPESLDPTKHDAL